MKAMSMADKNISLGYLEGISKTMLIFEKYDPKE